MTDEQEYQYFTSLLPSKLPDNPSQSGWSAQQIKEQYSKAPMYLYNKAKEFEAVLNTISGYFSSGQALVALTAIGDEDGNNIKATYFAGVTEIAGSKSSTFQKKYFRFTNKNGDQAGLAVVDLQTATTEYAGIMSASDKVKVENIQNKVDKVTSANKVYITGDDGSQTTAGYDDYATGVFVRRNDSGGHIYVPTTPTATTHAVSKAYADTFGKTIELTIDSSTYVMTAKLKDAGGNTLSTQTIDLPLETMVVGGSYDNVNKKVVLTLDNGNTVEFSVADLVSGLIAYSDFNVTGGAVTSVSINGVNYAVAENVAITTLPKVVQSTTDLPETNDGYMYLVLDNGYLYTYDANDGWEQAYAYTSDLLTITEVDNITED